MKVNIKPQGIQKEMENMSDKTSKKIETATNEQEALTLGDKSFTSSIPFISMKRDNIKLFRDSIQKVGDDYIFLFDIDDTLYKSSEAFYQKEEKSFFEAFESLREKSPNKDIPPAGVALRQNPLFTATFYKYFDLSPIQLEAYRKRSNYKDYLERDDKLKEFLFSLPYRKWAFTNGLRCRAEPILEVLGLTECFEGVICFDDQASEIIGKPKDNAYEFVEDLLGIENKSKVFFFDDAPQNIETGKKFGWRSIHVRKEDDIIDLVQEELKTIKF